MEGPLTGQVRDPDPLVMNGRGYACVFPENEPQPIWIPSHLIRPCTPQGTLDSRKAPTYQSTKEATALERE
jgi:hypothetical protein